MSFTVAPLHNLHLPAGTRAQFGDGFVLQDVPQWLKNEPIIKELSRPNREGFSSAKHALVAEYEARAIGEPDPSWKGNAPKSIQERKLESVILGNLALWLRQPSTVCSTNVFHAISWRIPEQSEIQPVVQEIQEESPLYCHPNDFRNPVTKRHVVKAGQLHAVMISIPRKNPVWEAMRACWAALTMSSADRRYPFFWMGLESLFGPDDNAGELSFKLGQRIAFFLADTPEVARELFQKVKNCYAVRSKIIHGRWKDDPKIDAVMADTEGSCEPFFGTYWRTRIC
jgi:hypothetical protein